MVSKNTQDQKKKDLKNQYQVVDLKEFDVMHTCTTTYPTQKVITREQWSEKIYNKRKVKSSTSSPIEKVSTSEKIDETEEEIQFKKPCKKSTRRKLHDENDKRKVLDIRYTNSKSFARCS